MVYNGGPNGSERYSAALGGFVAGLAIMGAVWVLLTAAADIGRISAGEKIARQTFAQCTAQRDQNGCESAASNTRSAVAAENAVRVALWQTLFSFIGLVGLGLTVLSARGTWIAARASAKADNDNLALTQAAMAEAKAEAAQQTERFVAQLEASKRAADAAVAANEINLKMSREQIRAHMFVIGASAMIDQNLVPTFKVTISNNGRTPAKRIGVSVSARHNFESLGSEGLATSKFLNPMSSGAIEKIEIRAEQAPLSPEQYLLISSQRGFFIAAIEVGYADILGNKHNEQIVLWQPVTPEKGVWFDLIAPPHFD